MGKNLLRTLSVLVILFGLLAGLYQLFFWPRIQRWGATEIEAARSMPGDDLAPCIASTRAITINAPQSVVWGWLTQLGADRAGFFSYEFLEKPFMEEVRVSGDQAARDSSMEVGRVVSSAVDPNYDGPQYAFKVLAVEPGKSFVLENWGSFLLEEPAPGATRLIVRTHGWETPGPIDRIGYFFMMPLHYIMERRMLLGIKQRAEAIPGAPPSQAADMVWVGCLFLSLVGIMILVVVRPGVVGLLPAAGCGLYWLGALLLFPPSPIYVAPLPVAIAVTLAATLKRKRQTPGSSAPA